MPFSKINYLLDVDGDKGGLALAHSTILSDHRENVRVGSRGVQRGRVADYSLKRLHKILVNF